MTGANDAPVVGSVDVGDDQRGRCACDGDVDDEVGSDVDGDALTWALVDITIDGVSIEDADPGRRWHHLE